MTEKSRAAELLRQRLKDRLLGRKGLLAEARRNVKSLTPAAIAESPGDTVPATAEVLDLVAKLKRLSLKTIAELEENGPEFVDRTAARIETVVSLLVEPELRDAVLSQQVLVEQWPLPWLVGVPRVTLILHGSLAKTMEASSEALQWARQRLPDNMRRWAYVPDDDDKNLVVPFDAVGQHEAGATHSAWLAARAVSPCPPRGTLFDVQRPTVHTTSALLGAHPGSLSDSAEVLSVPAAEDRPASVTFKWADGEVEQLDLFTDPAEGQAPLLAVSRKHGAAAVRDIFGLYMLTFARSASADEMLWWWPDEHLEVMGRKVTRDNREDLCRRLDALQRTHLKVEYHRGRALKGPLVAFAATDGLARQVKLHPALYKGVQHEDGTAGTWWWWGPLELLSAPVERNATRVHTLAVKAGSMWRASLRDGKVSPAEIGAARLADHLGIRGRAADERYETDAYAARTLRETLEAAQAAGVLGSWDLKRGRLEDLDSAVLVLRPTTEALEFAAGTRLIERPARLPATGLELAAWLKQAGWNATEAGERLEVAGSTMRRAATYGGRPLPEQVRKALRRYLWPGIGGR